MPGTSLGEAYFVALMMILILVVSFTATYFFFRQYNREKKMIQEAKQRKLAKKMQAEKAEKETVETE